MHKQIAKLLSITFLSATAFLSLTAKATLVPLPSVLDYTNGDGWGNGVGMQIESSAVYRGADKEIVEIKLEGASQWRRGNQLLFWEGYDLNETEIGWRGLFQNKWLLEGGARHEIVIPSSRSEKAGIKNLPHRGSHVLGFMEARYSVDDNWRNWVSGRFTFGSNDYGWQSKLSAGHRLSGEYRNNGTELVLFSTFASPENKNNYFGLSQEDADASGLQATELDGGYRSSGINLIYRKQLNRRLQLAFKAGVEQYADDIEKSELVGNSTETNTEISLVWH